MATMDAFLTAKTLRKFMKRVEEIEKTWEAKKHGDPELWYRGVQKSYWTLVPKLYRPSYPLRELLQIEDEVREEFVRRAPSLTPYKPDNAWEWYFLMQHYAAPTRLLDWTQNPLVGLYFAVKDSEGLHDAAVWVLDAWRLNKEKDVVGRYEVLPTGSPGLSQADTLRYRPWLPNRFDAKQQLKKKFPVAVYPNQFDRRIAAQRSCFTVHGVRRESLDKLFPASRRFLSKIIIPGYATEQVRDELKDYGIDEATIYPDLEGLGKSVGLSWLPTDEETPHDGLYTQLKPSPIHGVGVFAIKPIKKGTQIFSGDSDEMRWVDAGQLPKAECLREFYDKFAIVKNGRPKRYACPRNFNRLTMSWFLNDPKKGDKPNVRCDENYDFWALRNIERDDELTVNSTAYSDHEDGKGKTPKSVQKKPKK
jgi:FRG domain